MFNHLIEDIASVLERDPAARTRWEVLTCYPGVHALFLHRLAHALWKRGCTGWRGSSPSSAAGSPASRSIPAPRLAACVHRPRLGV